MNISVYAGVQSRSECTPQPSGDGSQGDSANSGAKASGDFTPTDHQESGSNGGWELATSEKKK